MRALPEERTRTSESAACVENAQTKSSCWLDVSWKLFQETALGFLTPDFKKGCHAVEVHQNCRETMLLPCACAAAFIFVPRPPAFLLVHELAKNIKGENSMTLPVVLAIGARLLLAWQTVRGAPRPLLRAGLGRPARAAGAPGQPHVFFVFLFASMAMVLFVFFASPRRRSPSASTFSPQLLSVFF